MSWITVAWSVVASACLTLALMHLVVWLKQRRQWAHLLFSVAAISVASVSVFELMLMRTDNVSRFAELIRLAHIPIFSMFISIVWFVRYYFGAGRIWLAWTVCGLRLLVLILNFFTGLNLQYTEITALRRVSVLGGETISIAEGVINPWYGLGILSSLVFVLFVVDASLAIWRRAGASDRRRAIVVGGGIALFVLAAHIHAGLIHAGIIDSPYMVSFAFMAVVVAMGYELSYDVLRAAELAHRLQRREAELLESERRLSLATDAAKLAVWEWDVARDEVWSTESGRELFGFRPSDKLSLSRFLDVVHRDDCERIRNGLMKILEEGGNYESEYRIVLPDGQTRWMAGRGRVEFNSGRAVRMRGVSLDITQRKQAAELLRLVFEAAPNAMIMVSAEGKIVLVNAQTEAIFGYSRDELIGQPVELLVPEAVRSVHPDYRQGYVGQPTARVIGAGRELFWRRKDGSEVPVELGLNPIETSEGLFVLASVIDITERRRAELEAGRQREELAHLSRVTMLGELSGSLAHELTQPLTAILSNAQAAQRFLAQGSADLAEVREILDDIVKDDKHAGEVIHRLRLLFKKGEVQRQLLDMNEVVRDVLKLMRSDLVNQNAEVETDLTDDLPVVSGDRVQLQQVLLNLVVNGCDAMTGIEAADRKLIVRTGLAGNGFIHVSVVDQGHGIPGERLERVFEPFFTTKAQGMGLGLAVCRTIISAHGGRLWTTNNADCGATFHFTLPLQSGATT